MTTPLTPADVLTRAADWFAEDPARWTTGSYLEVDGCRCALGGIAAVLDPADPDGNPLQLRSREKSLLGEMVVDFLAHYLADHHEASLVAGDLYETVAAFNDDQPGPEPVIAALRAAATEWTQRQTERQARGAA